MLAFYIKIVIILSNLTSMVAGINHTLQTLINSENLYDKDISVLKCAVYLE